RIVRVQALRRLAPRSLDLDLAYGRLDRADHALGDPILELEHIGDLAVVTIAPHVRACRGLDELRGDPKAVAALAHAALHHVADAELAPDFANIDGLALVRERRVAGDDEEPAKPGEARDDLFHHAVGEVLLLRVARHVRER